MENISRRGAKLAIHYFILHYLFFGDELSFTLIMPLNNIKIFRHNYAAILCIIHFFQF